MENLIMTEIKKRFLSLVDWNRTEFSVGYNGHLLLQDGLCDGSPD